MFCSMGKSLRMDYGKPCLSIFGRFCRQAMISTFRKGARESPLVIGDTPHKNFFILSLSSQELRSYLSIFCQEELVNGNIH